MSKAKTRNKPKKRKAPRISDDELVKLGAFADNQYVKDFDEYSGKFTYTKRFYIDMYDLISSGKTYAEAYDALGFDSAVLGKNRANSAGKRAVAMAKDGSLHKVSPDNYDGSKPEGFYEFSTQEEELAYYKARTIYLSTMVEAQKKIPSALREILTSSKSRER